MAARKSAKTKDQINLLPQEEFASSTLGRILAWAISTFRIIVIAVELVVVIAFLSRFWLDAKLADLNDEIKQKQAVIVSQSSFETTFRNAQQKLNIFSKISAQENQSLPFVQKIISVMPSDTQLVSLAIVEKEVDVKANGLTEQSVAQFIANLEGLGIFESVTLRQIDSDENSAFIGFIVSGELK